MSDDLIEGGASSAENRRAEIRARLADSPEADRLPWVRKAEFEKAGRPYREWFGWDRADIWPELLDSQGIPIPTVYTGCKIGQMNISIRELPDKSPREGKRVQQGFRATMNEPVPTVQCTNISFDGKRCGRWAMKGLSVCYVHGGKTDIARQQADDVLSAARMRMYSLADQAIEVLDRVTRNGSTAPDAVQVKAATELLDRVGLKTPVEIDVTVDHKISPTDAVLGNLSKLAENQRKSITPGTESDDSDVVDAELVIEVDD